MILLLAAGTAEAQRQWTATGQAVPELAAIDQMIRNRMVQFDIRAATVAVAKDGRLVYARGYTWDDASAEPVQPTSLFRTLSVNKAITSIAIHQLIEDGLLSYQTPVASTLGLEPIGPWSPDPWLRRVTVDHLLTHTGGWDRRDGFRIDPMVFQDELIAGWLGVAPPPTRHEIATFTAGMRFQFEPGTRWAYSNVGYLLLQLLAEQATGQDFPEYVFENIFRPVGVSRARLAHTLRSDLAPTERDYDGDYQGDPYALTVENHFAGGGAVMAAPDLARVFSVLFDNADHGGLLEHRSFERMLELPFAVSVAAGYGRGWVHESYFLESGQTLGWLTRANDGAEIYGHGGGGPGTHALAVWQSQGITFVMLTNKDPLIENLDDFPHIASWPQHDLWESVGISAGAAGSAPAESWVQAVAHTDGVGDSVWRSDVGLLNRSPEANRVRLRLHRGGQSWDHELQLAPGAYRTVADVVAELGQEGSGPLQIFSSESLTVSSRTYNQSAEGSFGQSLDGVTATGGLQSGQSAVLMQLREDGTARSNIGILNQWRRSAEAEIALYDGAGLQVATFIRTIPAQRLVRINRPFLAEGGRQDVASGYAVVSVLSGQDVFAYGSVVDNATGDPTTNAMKVDSGSANQWVAAAASGEGAHGSRWRTDLSLLNRSGGAATADVIYHGDDGAGGSLPVVLGAGEQLAIEDVVSEIGLEGSGSIEIESDRPVLVSSRTYNTSDVGTFGQSLDGWPAERTADAGDTVWLPQLQQNTEFRTNLGLINTGTSEARVRIRLRDAAGAELATARRRLDPGARLQLQEPFARIAGRSDVEAGYATVTVESGDGVIAYASVIDNATNDPTTVRMRR
jgi:CubicO group peptidase (beta-lactamase class C family)